MKANRPGNHIFVFIAAFLLTTAFSHNLWAYFPGYEKILDSGLVQQAKGVEGASVIVTLKSGREIKDLYSSDDSIRLKSVQNNVLQIQEKVVSRMEPQMGAIKSQLKNVPIFSARLSGEGLMGLAAMDEVAFIEEDRPLQLFTAQGIPLIQPGTYRDSAGGAGVAIAVIDDGFNYNHPALGGGGFPNAKIIGGYDFGDNDADPMEGVRPDKEGNLRTDTHGTCCAGIAAGINTNAGFYQGGVAPKAKIYALKVATQKGNIPTSGLIKAWDWCITHQNDDPNNPIMVVSVSMGESTFQASTMCDDRRPSIGQITEAVVARGMAVFVASGNDSQRNSVACTACISHTISVGAVFDAAIPIGQNVMTAPDQVTYYSNSSEILDLLAPSHNACTPAAPGSEYDQSFGGTSAACPYAAGAAAVIQSHHKSTTGKFLTVQDLRKLMTENGDPILDPKSGITKPRVNISKSILAIGASGNGSADAAADAPEPSSTGRSNVEEVRQSEKPKKDGSDDEYQTIIDF